MSSFRLDNELVNDYWYFDAHIAAFLLSSSDNENVDRSVIYYENQLEMNVIESLENLCIL